MQENMGAKDEDIFTYVHISCKQLNEAAWRESSKNAFTFNERINSQIEIGYNTEHRLKGKCSIQLIL